jgi:hypothetical protein
MITVSVSGQDNFLTIAGQFDEADRPRSWSTLTTPRATASGYLLLKGTRDNCIGVGFNGHDLFAGIHNHQIKVHGGKPLGVMPAVTVQLELIL